VDCDSLRVKGDVHFGSGVSLKGSVSLFNEDRDTLWITDRRRIRGDAFVSEGRH
jgi:hypothetical protein